MERATGSQANVVEFASRLFKFRGAVHCQSGGEKVSGRTYPNKPSPVKADSGAQTQPSRQPLKKVSPSAYTHDFSQEYLGKKVEMTVASNITVEGVIEKASKYWFKVNSGGEVVYVNKAWVIAIKQLK